jgi:hypothetical protein
MRVALTFATRQILAAGDWLGDLDDQVKANLASKPVRLVWGMKDVASWGVGSIGHLQT